MLWSYCKSIRKKSQTKLSHEQKKVFYMQRLFPLIVKSVLVFFLQNDDFSPFYNTTVKNDTFRRYAKSKKEICSRLGFHELQDF